MDFRKTLTFDLADSWAKLADLWAGMAELRFQGDGEDTADSNDYCIYSVICILCES
jgi:hypothetical protein